MSEIKTEKRDGTLRIFELLLVLAIAFANPLIHSIYTTLHPEIREIADRTHNNFNVFSTVVSELCAIGVLFYVLAIRKRSITLIGLRANSRIYWFDNIVVCIALTLAAYILTIFGYGFIEGVYHVITNKELVLYAPGNFAQGSLLLWIVFMIINPFFEELIVRGYLMSELDYLTQHQSISIIVSVVLQTSYHLYQGWASALCVSITFIVYSLYFAKCKKIMPIILSHLYFDLAALFYYRFQ